MHPFQIKACCLSLLASALSTTPCLAQTPAPAPEVPFTIPLTDQTLGAAILLPTQDGAGYLVYSTTTGKLGFYLWTPTTPTPNPNPNPNPSPDPNPPPLNKATRLIIVAAQANIAPSNTIATWLTAHAMTSTICSIDQVADPNTPPESLHWIGRTAGKSYPYFFLADAQSKTLAEGTMPPTERELIAILQRFAIARTANPCCPNGKCPIPFAGGVLTWP